jgi:serine/threonine protein kinase
VEIYLREVGRVVREFGDRTDSRARIFGVEAFGSRFVVKTADDDEAVGWLRSAADFHRAVQHPAIAGLVATMTTPTGLALVEEWAAGEPLLDPFDPRRAPIESPESGYARLRALPVPLVVDAITTLLEAHEVVAAAGFVAVDLYDGCLLYDFARNGLSLIDLDHYRPGPYLLEADRQLGSLSYMAPEELQRGARIDERTTVFTLGRLILVLLGCTRRPPAEREAFRGSDAQYDVSVRATHPQPGARWSTVRGLAAAWRAAAAQNTC